jgi:hypothetical protein
MSSELNELSRSGSVLVCATPKTSLAVALAALEFSSLRLFEHETRLESATSSTCFLSGDANGDESRSRHNSVIFVIFRLLRLSSTLFISPKRARTDNVNVDLSGAGSAGSSNFQLPKPAFACALSDSFRLFPVFNVIRYAG